VAKTRKASFTRAFYQELGFRRYTSGSPEVGQGCTAASLRLSLPAESPICVSRGSAVSVLAIV